MSKYLFFLRFPVAIFKMEGTGIEGKGNMRKGTGEWGIFKIGILKSGNLWKRESLKLGIFKSGNLDWGWLNTYELMLEYL